MVEYKGNMQEGIKHFMMENEKKDPIKILRNLIQNEPLIEPTPSIEGINPKITTYKDKSIYYGTGLCTAKELSIALPFDVLGMVLVAENIRRQMGMDKIYHHIADTHAKSNNLFKDYEVEKQAANVKKALTIMKENLGFKNLEIVLASEFDQTDEYNQILNNIETDKHEYVKRELADISWYQKYKNVDIKIGWIIQASETNLGFDERIFDREYKKKVGGELSFIYLKPGRTFDKSRPKVSPYIHVIRETRILLKSDEDVKGKMTDGEKAMGDKHLGGARRHLTNIVRLYEKLFGSFGKISLEEKIEAIIEKTTK